MIEKQKSLLQTEETEKVSKKPLSNEELSSLIKASNNKKDSDGFPSARSVAREKRHPKDSRVPSPTE